VKAPLAFYLPVKLKSDDWGRTSAEPAHQRLRRFHRARRHRRLRRAAARTQHVSEGFVARFFRW
jgi:hypothetical protein